MKNKVLFILLVIVFSLVSAPSSVFAIDCGGCTAQTNNENLAKTIKLTEAAIVHAKEGHQEQTVAAISEAKGAIKLIVTGDSQKFVRKSRASYEISDAVRSAKKGELEQSIAYMEKALPLLNEIGTFE